MIDIGTESKLSEDYLKRLEGLTDEQKLFFDSAVIAISRFGSVLQLKPKDTIEPLKRILKLIEESVE